MVYRILCNESRAIQKSKQFTNIFADFSHQFFVLKVRPNIVVKISCSDHRFLSPILVRKRISWSFSEAEFTQWVGSLHLFKMRCSCKQPEVFVSIFLIVKQPSISLKQKTFQFWIYKAMHEKKIRFYTFVGSHFLFP